jgi:hypothetical protein
VPTFSIQAVHTEFVDAGARTTALVNTAKSLTRPGGKAIHVRDLEEIAGLAVLKLTLAWESFLEDSFLRYVCGATSCAGGAPTLSVPKEPNLKQAYASLLSGQKFLGWQPSATTKRANKCFVKGEPYDAAIGGAKTDLEQISSIRNRVAHRSPYSIKEFQAVVVAELGYVPKGMTAGRFLLTPLPSKGGAIALDHYRGILTATAFLIANHT